MKLNYEFKNPELLKQALTHKSFHFEAKVESSGHNEKLEFLGDAVLDLALSELLMEILPDQSEGVLSKRRASLVNEAVLHQVAQNLQLSASLLLGKGEILTGGDKKPRLLASAYEALLGAIFLDGGYQAAKTAIRLHFNEALQFCNSEIAFAEDFKTRLQEITQAERKVIPTYRLSQEQGLAHDRSFEVEIFFGPQKMASGWGKSKKQAEQAAAQKALDLISQTGSPQ